MKIGLCSDLERGGRPRRAMTLVEMIGVLAIIGVLAVIALPSAIRYLDRVASEREEAYLDSAADAFTGGILRARYITNAANWANFIASAGGQDLASLTQNPRRNQRVYLYDKGGWLNSALPYAQTNQTPPGLTGVPTNARVMIVSSLGAPLPTTLNNTDMDATQFDDLWNTAPRTVPGTGPWSGWGGMADDVKVERVNLANLFVNVVLSTYTGTNKGLYKIDNQGVELVNGERYYRAPYSNGVFGYFLKGTVIDLYSSGPQITKQHSEVLERDTSFVYENGVWAASINGGVATGAGDISGIVAAFLAATPNTNALNKVPLRIQQTNIVVSFITYMSNYNAWEDAGFPNGTKAYLAGLQNQMMTDVEGLFFKGNSSNDHYPTNDGPCIIP